MKLLKICTKGLPLFRDNCDIDFVAPQRVNKDNASEMNCIFTANGQSYYQNNVLSFIGVNASGKTTILKLLNLLCRMLNNEALNNISSSEILDGLSSDKEAVIDIYFYAKNDTINQLHTVISRNKGKLLIKDEYLKTKPSSSVKSKKTIFEFEKITPEIVRNKDEAFLLDDVSICVAFNKKNNDKITLTDTLQYTNLNELNVYENCPAELIEFFDPSIEYLKVDVGRKKTDIRLKFKKEDEIILSRTSELNRYLSSGTIKGINIFIDAMNSFKTGGYVIIDELENHFNHEIISTLIGFYKDKKINPNGAMLIFSTHYAELLDEFERNDNIFIVRNLGGITSENLSFILKRNDLKKSEVYQSDYLDGTAPNYESYMKLKKKIICSQKEEV